MKPTFDGSHIILGDLKLHQKDITQIRIHHGNNTATVQLKYSGKNLQSEIVKLELDYDSLDALKEWIYKRS